MLLIFISSGVPVQGFLSLFHMDLGTDVALDKTDMDWDTDGNLDSDSDRDLDKEGNWTGTETGARSETNTWISIHGYIHG